MCNTQCTAILKTGPNKGRQCGNYAKSGSDLCGVHQRCVRNNQVVPLPLAVGVPVVDEKAEPPKKGVRKWFCGL